MALKHTCAIPLTRYRATCFYTHMMYNKSSKFQQCVIFFPRKFIILQLLTLIADFAKHVGPTVKSDRKPMFFSDQMSAIVRDRISVFTDVRSRFPRFSFEAWFPVKVKILIPRLNYFEGPFHGERGRLVLLMGQSL